MTNTTRALVTTLAIVAIAACSDDDSADLPPTTAASATSSAASTPAPTTAPAATTTAAPTPNGLILYGTTDGDIAAVDPVTGATRTVLDGPEHDNYPYLSPDGRRMLFDHRDSSGKLGIWVANIDGSGAKSALPDGSRMPSWIEWSPNSNTIGIVPTGGGDATLIDIDSGSTSTVDVEASIVKLGWLKEGTVVLVTQNADGTAGYAVAADDGTGFTPLPVVPDATDEWSLSDDGTKLAYMSWGSAPGTQGRIHVLDVAHGTDQLITPVGDGFEWEEPVFSPDGRWVKLDRFDATDKPLQATLLATDGSGRIVLLGAPQVVQDGGSSVAFAPDGREIIVRYNATGDTYRYDTSTGTGEKVTWPALGDSFGWQRVDG